ncbi:sugar phosphate isomerase/epimerase [Patescibacteria group bacterium]|nr:sugar phosphate isomerase/epimerase [Patescibacteria group bacterium]
MKRLVDKYELPVKVIQTSKDLNVKEMNQALDLAGELGVDTITINPPGFFNIKSYKFIVDNLENYKKANPGIKFSLINPEKGTILLALPKYRFNSIIKIIKTYHANLGLDIANLEEEEFESGLLRNINNYVPYISTIYLSDKTQYDQTHIVPGEGVLNIPSLLKKLDHAKYKGYMSLKLTIDKKDLASMEKIDLILQRCIKYYKEHYTENDN